mmetsp:Transcript_46237/g.106760  ORF Transcript_46237/g.106760 Transcript_46237/m.106760 type:complete len:133 (+) Transcript_46237:429-827(+)
MGASPAVAARISDKDSPSSVGRGGLFGGGSAGIPVSQPHLISVQTFQTGRLGSLNDSHSLADSFTNCSMSFSPDDLETHIRKRFEECKRVAVQDGGELGSSPPAQTYGFGGLGVPQFGTMGSMTPQHMRNDL